MGCIGCGVYEEFILCYGEICFGVEICEEVVNSYCEEGCNVIFGDVIDLDFWECIFDTGKVKLVLLVMFYY